MSIAKEYDIMRAEYEAEKSRKKKELQELIAREVYERGMRFQRQEVPKWVINGNSTAQEESRSIAASIIELMKKYEGAL